MKQIDLTSILQAVIMLLSALVSYRLIPWIKSKTSSEQFSQLETAARVAVYAAEQTFKSGHGAEKMQYVLNRLQSSGYSVDSKTMKDVIEKSVYEMNASPNMKEIVGGLTQSPGEIEKLATESMDISKWTANDLETFCIANNIPHDGCTEKEDFIKAIQSDFTSADAE